MKTQEEIEQLYTEIEKLADETKQEIEQLADLRIGYSKGYTQCQNDMADKKYTEEDMMIIRNKLVSILPTGDISAWDMLQAVSKYIKWFDDYIKSLNKQD